MQRHKERAFGARLIGVVVAAVCGLAAGCGGSGSNETASSSTNASGASSDIQPPTPTKDVATNATDVPTYVLVAVGEAASEDQESFTLLADLNENGTVVGELIRVLNLQDERPRQGSFAFVWRDGQLDELGALHSLVHDSRAQGINDFDEIVGWSYPGTDAQPAFVWRNGQMTPLDLADAYAVNNSGQVVGYATQVRGNEASSMAVVWHSGQVTELRELANPWNINDAGDVVGFSLINSTPRASLFRAGTVTILGTLPGASASQAFDINEVGQVVGTSHFSPADGSDGYDRAFLWEDGRMRELEPLSSDDKADAYGINDRGVVVGRSGASQFVAVIWLDSAPYDLNALIAKDDPLRPFVTLLEARGINNRGEIIAQGIDARRPGAYTGYVLKPK